MNYNFISFVPLETCIGDSLNTFNINYTSLDINMKNLSSEIGSNSSYLISSTQTMSSVHTTRIQELSSQIPSLVQTIQQKSNFYNFLSSSPNNTVPVLVFYKQDLPYNNVDIGIVASGTGATLAQVPSNLISTGAKRGKYATDFQKKRNLASQVAASDYSVILNGKSNSVSGLSAEYSFVGAGNNNLVSSRYSTILTGTGNSALSTYVVAAGNNNLVDKSYCSVFGNNNITFYSASASTTICPASLTAGSGSAAQILGSNGLSYYENQCVYSNGCFSQNGDSQYSVFVLRDVTTDSISYMAPIPVQTLPAPYTSHVPRPNFLPIYPKRIWNMRIRVTGVTSTGMVSYFDNNLVLKRNSGGVLEYVSGHGAFAGPVGTNTSLTLAIEPTCYIQLQVASFYGGSPTWYWTAVIEVIESGY